MSPPSLPQSFNPAESLEACVLSCHLSPRDSKGLSSAGVATLSRWVCWGGRIRSDLLQQSGDCLPPGPGWVRILGSEIVPNPPISSLHPEQGGGQVPDHYGNHSHQRNQGKKDRKGSSRRRGLARRLMPGAGRGSSASLKVPAGEAAG